MNTNVILGYPYQMFKKKETPMNEVSSLDKKCYV